MTNITVIITAAGSSSRIGNGIKKEYLPFKNGTVLSSCAKTFFKALEEGPQNYNFLNLIITCPPGQLIKCQELLFSDGEFLELLQADIRSPDFFKIVEGGASRQESVYKALKAVKDSTQIVLIHDGARPFVSQEIIQKGIETALTYGASVPAITPIDTQKEIDQKGFISRHLCRNQLASVQTPQNFTFESLLQAYTKAMKSKQTYTDDTEIWGQYCGPVKTYQGSPENIKITYPQDLEKLN
ncbi:MAG: 2-C-methyl-D-erythritol 4-phosphate cytidylyltransferase [Treponema sp.]|nr:2-C-methyl-D-erythritol 4-phosphate cytidylyltransferase [Treponema sp.]